MTIVAVGISESRDAIEAARTAAAHAKEGMGGKRTALAVVFASAGYSAFTEVPGVVTEALDGAPVIGGSSGGCLWGADRIATVGVSVVAIGGDDICAATASVQATSPSLVEVVPVAARLVADLAKAARPDQGFVTCLVIAPGLSVDGEALVAAVRKGIGAGAQLAGGMAGRSDYRTEKVRVFCDTRAYEDRIVLAAMRTTRPLGVVARHGWKSCGKTHAVTKTDGVWLVEMDGRPAFDVWMEDARAAGGTPPDGRGNDVVRYLAGHYELGLIQRGALEPIVRAPVEIRDDGAVRLAGSVTEGARVELMHGARADILNAVREAARDAKKAVDKKPAGALIFACAGIHDALGSQFPSEPSMIADILDAPTGGACVFGEIERARREVDAFHNTTSVILAFPGDET